MPQYHSSKSVIETGENEISDAALFPLVPTYYVAIGQTDCLLGLQGLTAS